jgi:hypothetical protein
MLIFGINIPSLAILLGTSIAALFFGLGSGIGSEIGKYYVNKFIVQKLDKLHDGINKITFSERLNIFKQNHKRILVQIAWIFVIGFISIFFIVMLR